MSLVSSSLVLSVVSSSLVSSVVSSSLVLSVVSSSLVSSVVSDRRESSDSALDDTSCLADDDSTVLSSDLKVYLTKVRSCCLKLHSERVKKLLSETTLVTSEEVAV